MDSPDADEILVAGACAVCTVTYIATNSVRITGSHMLLGIANVDHTALTVY
jgi:hypothetical protein